MQIAINRDLLIKLNEQLILVMKQNTSYHRLNKGNINALVQLMIALWPECKKEEELDNCYQLLSSEKDYCLLANQDDEYIGFIHISLRYDPVEGTTSSPVGYIEGIYILPACRRQGVGEEMVGMAEQWAVKTNCHEIASDTEIHNKVSIDFHQSLGFEEINRIVCFSKKINTET